MDFRMHGATIKIVFSLALQLWSTMFFLRRIQGDNIINLQNLHVTYLSLLPDLSYTLLSYSTDFLKIITYRIL
jgi:hypothetical protein